MIALHGFTQTGRAWDGVKALARERPFAAPDLRGHGRSADRRPVDTATLVRDVLARAPRRFVLVGYSMGARLALHVALAAPDRVARLVLCSTTAGLEDERERATRRASDEALAALLERDGIEAFAARWEALALWTGQPAAVRAAARAERLAQDPAGLAASLRGFGAGTMPAVWARLAELTMPAALLAGEHDARYVALGERLAAELGDARLHVVPGAGHALTLEAPAAVADHIERP